MDDMNTAPSQDENAEESTNEAPMEADVCVACNAPAPEEDANEETPAEDAPQE